MNAASPEAAPFSTVVVVANARIPGERAQSIQTVRTAAAFARAGFSVRLLYARRRVKRAISGISGNDPLAYYGNSVQALRDRLHPEPVPVVDYIESVPRRFQYIPAKVEEFTFAWNAARRIQQFKGALVHCREIEVGYLLARRRHPFYLYEAHSIPDHPVRRRTLGRVLEGAAGVVAITDGLANDLADLYSIPRESIAVVPDAFEPEDFKNVPDRNTARERLSIGSDAPVIVYTGHLFAWKGIFTLLDAAALAPELHFRIVGGLPEDLAAARAHVESLKLRNVILEGHRPPAQIPEFLAAADVVVVPNSGRQPISARHTSPLKLFEAMAAGRALVASDIQSLREVLTHDRNAKLVKADDPAALAGALRALAADRETAARIAAQAKVDVARFTYDARVKTLVSFATARMSVRAGAGRGPA